MTPGAKLTASIERLKRVKRKLEKLQVRKTSVKKPSVFLTRDLYLLVYCVEMQRAGQHTLVALNGEHAAYRRLDKAGLVHREPGTRDRYLPTYAGERMVDHLLITMIEKLEKTS